jgi:hypothetical protein
MRRLRCAIISDNLDGFAKSPSAALRFAGQGFNVRTVRLTLARLARLAYGAFCEAVTLVLFGRFEEIKQPGNKIGDFLNISDALPL